MAIIELNSVNKIYRTDEIETLALENVNIAIEKGEFVSVMGPSGCGKSTLLNIVGLLDTPTSGTVSIDGTTLRIPQRKTRFRLPELPPHQLAQCSRQR